MENPSDCEVCFCDAQGDVMAARVVGIRQEGVNPCRMVPSMRDKVHGSCMTSRARSTVRDRELPCEVRELQVAALELREIKKKNELENKSKPRFRVNRIPRSGVKDPLFWAQDNL